MRFSRVALANWRNFVLAEVSLQNRVFLVGPNASGKSNFLDVFRFLRDLVVPGGGFEQAVISRGGITKLRSLAARRDPAGMLLASSNT
jgi:predicted ATPase